MSASSSAFDVTVGIAAQLVFTTEPAGATGGTAFTTQPTVTVEDAGGNTVTRHTPHHLESDHGPGYAVGLHIDEHRRGGRLQWLHTSTRRRTDDILTATDALVHHA